jgi:stearoyl-CoA desaturase (delta-9 desaturase)
MRQKEFNWVNISFLMVTPILAAIGAVWYTLRYGIALGDMVAFFFMFSMTGLAITAGYHRYYSHRTYDCHWSLQLVYLLFGAAAVENSLLHWASDHRYHHRFVDEDQDPYNIMRGIFWAHMGWIFYKDQPNRQFENVPDLKNDALVLWQHKYYVPLVGIIGFGLPTLIGLAFGRPFGGMLWGGLVRTVALQHGTFLINSAAHFFGTQPYSNQDSSRDNWPLAFLTFGEGYHNYHHTFQGDYRNGIAWYHFDPAKWWISAFEQLGLTSRLNRADEWLVMKAKMEMELLKVKPWLEVQPKEWRDRLYQRIEIGRERARVAVEDMKRTKRRYQEMAREAQAQARREARELKVQWARQLQEARAASDQAWEEYKLLLREFRRSAAPVR